MWLAREGDAGYSSRNDLQAQGEARFRLDNGQVDSYPRTWTLPLETIVRAIAYFEETGQRAPFVDWHDDGQ